ncbi:MAG: tetratricopeptide repeat protein [Bacteroidales bacterium]|nr:tetratricopeptide repeat protein [Bacteroidales bacterium]
MKYLFLFLSIFLLPHIVFSQQDTIEELRAEGWEAKLSGDLSLSIEKYSAILTIDPADYDAKLALARLWFDQGDYKQSIDYYRMIYSKDTTDVEALYGFGRCNIWLEAYPAAVHWLNRSLYHLPGYIPAYLELGRVYSYWGKLDSAIYAFNKAVEADPENATAWAGLGRMYYWKSMPVTALKYYKKAIAIAPNNPEIAKEYARIKEITMFNIGLALVRIQEKEPEYVIDATVQRYSLSKRITDRWMIYLSSSFDWSVRDVENDFLDTARWYDNSWMKLMYISENHNISGHIGYSKSDKKLSTYGINYTYATSLKGLKIRNSLTTAYSYFYYWNQAGKHYLSDNLSFTYKRADLSLNADAGLMDEAPTVLVRGDAYDTTSNSYISLSGAANFTLTKSPLWKIGFTASYYDFKYISSKYYTPYDRVLYGPTTSLSFRNEKWFFSGIFAYMIGSEKTLVRETTQENELMLDVDNWSGSIEGGYKFKLLSITIGGSRFVNPYYENYTLHASLRFRL